MLHLLNRSPDLMPANDGAPRYAGTPHGADLRALLCELLTHVGVLGGTDVELILPAGEFVVRCDSERLRPALWGLLNVLGQATEVDTCPMRIRVTRHDNNVTVELANRRAPHLGTMRAVLSENVGAGDPAIARSRKLIEEAGGTLSLGHEGGWFGFVLELPSAPPCEQRMVSLTSLRTLCHVDALAA